MTEKELNNANPSNQREHGSLPSSAPKKQSRGLWIIFLVFIVFVAIVFLTQRKESIDWVEDYDAGLRQARQQDKALLLAFYKQFTRYTTATFEDTYRSSDVITFVETNFVPILIDVDKQPAIAERYEVGYYPTHYVQRPDSNDIFGPMLGYDPPALFIEKLKELLAEMNQSG
ncbi:MAG: DUF255 domain-containing protein [Planctomycetota bacterium]|jgi:hypothetical protein